MGRHAGAQAGPRGMRLLVPLLLQQQHQADREDGVDVVLHSVLRSKSDAHRMYVHDQIVIHTIRM
jgi:hypothetical protein